MADIEITVDGGTSKRLLTAGKYCDKNILVTAAGGSEEGMAFVARTYSTSYDSTSEISGTLTCVPGETVLCIVIHRVTISTPSGWEKAFESGYLEDSGVSQQVTVFVKRNCLETESFSVTLSEASRAGIAMLNVLCASENISFTEPYLDYFNVSESDGTANTTDIKIEKNDFKLNLNVIQHILAGASTVHEVSPDWLNSINYGRFLVLINNSPIASYSIKYAAGENVKTMIFSIVIPFSKSETTVSYSEDGSSSSYDIPAQTALNIITGVQ